MLSTVDAVINKKQKLSDDEICDKTVLRFSKLSENAFTPTRGSKQAAGFDIYR